MNNERDHGEVGVMESERKRKREKEKGRLK